MSYRLVIITEIIAPYRIPVFNALAQLPGVDLHVIFLAETDSTQRHWLIYRDEMKFSFQVLGSWRRRIRGYNILLNWGLSAALRRFSPNVIVMGGYNYLASWRGLGWARIHGVPVLLWAESNLNDQRSQNAIVEFLKRTFIRACRAFVVPGGSSREYLKRYGAPANAIFDAPNAVDNDYFAKGAEMACGEPESHRRLLSVPERYFLFVGRLISGKGVFDLLEAYALLEPEVRGHIGLVFVGDGPARQQLAKQAESITPGSVQIKGFAQREQLAIYYGLADVFIFPTHSDPWGLVVNEAMACGLPILSSDVAGCVTDLVSEGNNGMVVKAGDVRGLARAMTFMADAETRKQMGASSSAIIKNFSPTAWAAGIKSAAEFALLNLI